MFGKKEVKTYTLTIEGMMCMHCVAHVKSALEGVKGVSAAEVNLEAANATVSATVSPEKLTAAVEAAGYKVTGVSEA